MVLISVIFLSGTRSGLIALLSLAILFFLRILLTSAKRGRIITILALFAIGFFVSVKMVQSAFPLAVERVFSLTSFSISNPASTDRLRVDLINAAWLMFLDHPTLGIGFGNFNLNYGSYSQIFMNKQLMVHNIFMGALAETGILGFISLMSIYIYIIYSALRALYLQKSDPGIFDQWFPLMLFVGVNIVLAFLLYGTFDRLMFTIFAINMITLRNQQKNFSQQHQEIGD